MNSNHNYIKKRLINKAFFNIIMKYVKTFKLNKLLENIASALL